MISIVAANTVRLSARAESMREGALALDPKRAGHLDIVLPSAKAVRDRAMLAIARFP